MTDDRQPTRPVPLPGGPAEGKGTVSVAHVQLGVRAIEALRALPRNDPEGAHVTADAILCDLLNQLGFGAVVAEYEAIEKWYA
jgi:hypothetical protein